ncbi:MAG: hypothetical protein L3J97_03560 [Thermoplasmata archaeon]|nr:hypothetical protein [Thermoplasmata archaeon]
MVTWILGWLHVITAIGWLGGGILFGFVISPALARLSPSSSGEFLVRVAPGVGRFFAVVAALTILFGALLLYNIGGFGLLSFSTTYGINLSIGVAFALAAFVVSEVVAIPLLFRAIRMVKDMQASGQHQPPAEFPRTMRLVNLTATLTVVLLILTSIFMVGAGFY